MREKTDKEKKEKKLVRRQRERERESKRRGRASLSAGDSSQILHGHFPQFYFSILLSLIKNLIFFCFHILIVGCWVSKDAKRSTLYFLFALHLLLLVSLAIKQSSES